MEYSMDAVAGKMIIVIVVLSAIIAAVSYFLFASISGETTLMATVLGVNGRATTADTIPFSVGVLFALTVNVIKIVLMKRAVINSLKREERSAAMYLKGQYLLRLAVAGVVLFLAGYFHANVQNEAGNPMYVNFMGAFFGIFAFPVAAHSMRFFLRDALKDNDEILVASTKSSDAVKDAIDELNTIGAAEDDTRLADE
ncbi:MAG: hypothetical protein FWF78_11095 [Defluviitaleaceae bacterium]|nr:hypothetical protein [Defluviitaleaceae bacterium]